MLILRLRVKSISGLSADFPFRNFSIAELVSWDIIRAFRCLLSVAVHKGHFL